VTVLVVAAHPDDEVLGAGGAMARFAAEGRDVHTLILGEGITSRAPTRGGADPTELAALVRASHEAAQRLGTRAPVLGRLPDNRFDHVDLLDVVKRVEDQLAEIRPTLVLTHHVGDLNVDHQITARAVLAATRPQPGQTVRTLMSFEVASATEWAYGSTIPFQPSVFLDITATLDTKLHALGAYESEMRPFPHARSVEGIRAQATRWGTTVGVAAAEAFQLLRAVR